MRDAARIRPMLSVLQRLWAHKPDMRLGQLIMFVSGEEDIFYIDDTVLKARLDEALKEINGTQLQEA